MMGRQNDEQQENARVIIASAFFPAVTTGTTNGIAATVGSTAAAGFSWSGPAAGRMFYISTLLFGKSLHALQLLWQP